jgi:hypothetical protein
LVTYFNGDICPYDVANKALYQVSYEIKCNHNHTSADELSSPIAVNMSDRCHPKFTFSNKHGCPTFETTPWIRYLSAHPSIIGILLILFGLIATFKGKDFFQLTVGILAFGLIFLLCMLFFSAIGYLDYLDPDFSADEIGLTLLSLSVSGFIAFVAGYVVYKAGFAMAILTLGVIVGFFLGVSLYNILFYSTNALWLLIVCAFGGALLLGFLAFAFSDYIMIYGTAFIGAYSLVRGISVFTGNFPTEALMYAHLSQGISPPITNYFLGYAAAILIIFVCGVCCQLRHLKDD